MDLTAIGVVFGYTVVALVIVIVTVGCTALFIISIKSDYVEPESTALSSRKTLDRSRQRPLRR
ncbi:MAG: adenylate cyclase [Rhodococcus sp. (in: high G+C Gram-positive bacteria)]|uniref:adenylate cyclase n=1 Tax=Rhodococcus sp. TaxID=1831 RepID=UPI003BB00190